MARFRKKPVEIDAWRNDGPKGAVTAPAPMWVVQACLDGTILIHDDYTLTIKTLEGDHLASVGDWIVRGIKGELYPVKPDIFEATYDPA